MKWGWSFLAILQANSLYEEKEIATETNFKILYNEPKVWHGEKDVATFVNTAASEKRFQRIRQRNTTEDTTEKILGYDNSGLPITQDRFDRRGLYNSNWLDEFVCTHSCPCIRPLRS